MMIFKKASVVDEVVESMEKFQALAAFENDTSVDKKRIEALNYLNQAAESFEKSGRDKEAAVVTELIDSIVKAAQGDDEERPDLTTEERARRIQEIEVRPRPGGLEPGWWNEKDPTIEWHGPRRDEARLKPQVDQPGASTGPQTPVDFEASMKSQKEIAEYTVSEKALNKLDQMRSSDNYLSTYVPSIVYLVQLSSGGRADKRLFDAAARAAARLGKGVVSPGVAAIPDWLKDVEQQEGVAANVLQEHMAAHNLSLEDIQNIGTKITSSDFGKSKRPTREQREEDEYFNPLTKTEFAQRAKEEGVSPTMMTNYVHKQYTAQMDKIDNLPFEEKINAQKTLARKEQRERERAETPPVRMIEYQQGRPTGKVTEMSVDEHDQLMRKKRWQKRQRQQAEQREKDIRGRLELAPGEKIPGEWHGGISDRPRMPASNIPSGQNMFEGVLPAEPAEDPWERRRLKTIKRRTSRIDRLKKFDILAARQEQRLAKKKA